LFAVEDYTDLLVHGFIIQVIVVYLVSVQGSPVIILRDNIVYVGTKPVMTYCTAVLRVLANGDSVKLMARGNAISHAVNVAEVTRNRFLNDLRVESIDIGTEELETDTGDTRNVSNITITLKKVR
jgi:archaea-specific DNA-binding protein